MTQLGTGLFPELQSPPPPRRARVQHTSDDSCIGAAVMEGKISPHRIGHYRERFARDPEGTRRLLTSLAPGLPYGRKRKEPSAGTGLFPNLGR